MKLRKLHIEDYKMFKDFDIDFLDENDVDEKGNPRALPIIVLAGLNGSGKTTLLEQILNNYLKIVTRYEVPNKGGRGSRIRIRCPQDIKSEDSLDFLGDKRLNIKNGDYFIYFPSGMDDTKKVADEFVKTFYFFLKEKDYRPSEVKEHFHNYMKSIFDGLEVGFKYSHLDREDNVWFINDNGENFEIKDLSTGEKTLLSKVLYLYFQDYKDKVILIDEPELSLHPSWQNKVLKIYENFAIQNNCQIIIATHSPHIIASAKNEYLRLLVKEENRVVVKELSRSPLDRDTNTILKTVMGANYLPQELEKLRYKYRELFNQKLENTAKAKKLEKEILEWESPNSSFWQGLAFDKELRSI